MQSKISNKREVGESSKMEGKELSESMKDNASDWATVPLAKVGRSSPEHVSSVLISASKFSVLSEDLEEVEEGEIDADVQERVEEEKLEEKELYEDFEGDSVEEDILPQQSRGKDKVVLKRGRKRGSKAIAQDVNPAKSSRPSRKKN